MTVPRGVRAWIRTLRVLSWVLLLVGPVLFGHAVVRLVTATPADEPPPWRVVRKDSRIDRLLPKGAALERIAEGFAWVEGPAWHRQDGYLLFSDVANNVVYQWRDGEGSRLFLKPSGYTGRTPSFEGASRSRIARAKLRRCPARSDRARSRPAPGESAL